MSDESSWYNLPDLVRLIFSVPGNNIGVIMEIASLNVKAVAKIIHNDRVSSALSLACSWHYSPLLAAVVSLVSHEALFSGLLLVVEMSLEGATALTVYYHVVTHVVGLETEFLVSTPMVTIDNGLATLKSAS